ncbi:unnamed protein product [Brachionus calyciflorus]|uniref:Uncharacterized protein n=1 Tax=Brachionus calyciflorus TaxID=104777 RepID=A0A814F1A4_9BILA|nr:unnamed protein product [Brachionus calyciflorus]
MQSSLNVNVKNRTSSFTDPKMTTHEKPTRSNSLVFNTPQTFITISNKIFNDLTQAIQLVQKTYLEKDEMHKKLTNSDYHVHELCQQFDYVFLLGLKNLQEGYWKIVLEFTHKNVINELKKLLNLSSDVGRGRAWIYHALNDNLMESYLRCFMDNKKLVSKFYLPGASLVSDEQIFEADDNLTIINWLQEKSIIPKVVVCTRCLNNLKLQKRADTIDGYGWRCSKCSTRKSIRTNTFLSQFNMPIKVILKLIFFWSIQTRQVDQADFLGVSRQTIVTFQQKLRLAALRSLDKSNVKLGGQNKVVEIDESLFIKVKHYKGKDLKRNHDLYFVDPKTGCHTNGIESVWCSGKVHIKSMRGVSRKYLTSYIDEFIWRKNECETRTDASDAILESLADQYNDVELVELFENLSTKTDTEDILDVDTVDRAVCLELPLYDDEDDDDVVIESDIVDVEGCNFDSQINNKILKFIESSDEILTLTKLSKEERKIVHSLAEKNNLKHITKKRETDDRDMIIAKQTAIIGTPNSRKTSQAELVRASQIPIMEHNNVLEILTNTNKTTTTPKKRGRKPKNKEQQISNQSLSLLITLVSGLENVEFKLFNDVPYLDHSIWPSHLRLKRQVVDQILNSPTHTLTQKMIDMNKSVLTDGSISLSQSPPGDQRKITRPANNICLSDDNNLVVKPKQIKIKKKKQVSIDVVSDADEISSSDQIDNEIVKLKEENSRILQQIKSEKILSHSYTPSTNTDLAVKSLRASNQFENKIQHIETYSKIIENATLNMDDCVKEMNDVYQNYENLYQSQEADQDVSIKIEDSVYDEKEKESNRQVLFCSSSFSSLQTSNTQDETYSKYDKFSMDSKLENENNYLDDSSLGGEEMRQDIRVDNNTKLLLSIEILQNGANEDIIKLYQCTRGHSQGEIESIFLLITTHGIYVLKRKDLNELQSEANIQNAIKYEKELFINHEQMDYIEVSLGDQSIHFVCFNKRQNCWITTASRNLTNYVLENIQTARLQNKQLKFPKISVFHEATQQKLALKKFISNEENLSPQEIEIKGYSLVFWEDQASAVNHLIHKEGILYFYSKSSNSNSSPEWKKAFFVLKNDVLTQYKSPNDKRPTQVIKLDGEDFSGCRKNNKLSRPNTIELIFSNSHFYLSAKNEEDASDWLQSFCKIISLGNFQTTDVPTLSSLPCCSVVTNNKLYFCHEDLVTSFYRLLESIKLTEINRISFDNDNPYYCILHDDTDGVKVRYWFVYFVDRNERNEFITCFKEAWETMFQVQLTIEKCKSSDMRKRCIKGVKMIQKSLDNATDLN